MLDYIRCCLVILLAALDLSTTADSSEKIADVIKNISRVNDVLQELIQNYEQLQNIYKSQENFEVADDAAVFREKSHNYTERNTFRGTTMYLSDQEVETTSSAKNITTTKNLPTTKSSQVIFIDTHKKLIDKKDDRNMYKEDYNVSKKTRYVVRDTVSEKENINTSKNFDVKQMMIKGILKGSAATRNAWSKTDKKILNNTTVYSVLEIVNRQTTKTKRALRNKKIHIKINTNLDTSRLAAVDTFLHGSKSGIRSRQKISTPGTLVMQSDSSTETENEDKSSKESNERKILEKYISRTNVLRKEYGDACLKLVVRKCYQTCKAVYKFVCRRDCKESFKESYDQFSRAGCIKSFVPTDAVKNGVRLPSNCTNSSNECSSETTELKKEDDKKPLLRNQFFRFDINEDTHGYLTAVCLPKKESVPTRKAMENGSNTTASRYETSLNILRSKYEKACIKTSREKCTDACTFSYTKACEKHTCKQKRLTTFSKACKRQCKGVFKFEGQKKTDSSSSSSSSDSD